MKMRQRKMTNDKIAMRIKNGILSIYPLQKDNIKPRKLIPCIKSLKKLYILFISNKPNNSTNHNYNASNCRANCNNIKTHNNITYDKSILSNCQEKEIVLFIYNTSNNSTNYNHSASNSNNNCHNIQVLKHTTYDKSILSNCQEIRNKLHNVVYSGCV